MNASPITTLKSTQKPKFYFICEKDVGLFSLIQQVISHIPNALASGHIPIVYFSNGCCYYHSEGYREAHNVWEYYFEPVSPKFSTEDFPEDLKKKIRENIPFHTDHGYQLADDIFITTHFGHHPRFRGGTLKIPYRWKDPDATIRIQASAIIKKHIRPRNYILQKVEEFFSVHMKGSKIVGVHLRGTDVQDNLQPNIERRGSFSLDRYLNQMHRAIKEIPECLFYIATDSEEVLAKLKQAFPEKILHTSTIFQQSGSLSGSGPSGWSLPNYLTQNTLQSARNGEEALIDYLLLSKCLLLIHNGSGLARTVLLKEPDLPHVNIHSKAMYIKSLLFQKGEVLFLLKYTAQKILRVAILVLKGIFSTKT